MVRWLVTLGAAAVASLSAWVVAGRAFDERARLTVAERWADAELCLVGPGLPAAAPPSGRLRAIALGPEGERGWPARCLDVARALDEALGLEPVHDLRGDAPSLAAALELPPPAREAAVDRLWSALRAANLPVAVPRWRGDAPQLGDPRLTEGKLISVTSDAALAGVFVDRTSADGVLRVALGKEACRWDARSSPSELRCRRPPAGLPSAPRLAWTEAGAPDLVFGRADGRAGFFDGTSAARLWSPPTHAAEAVMRANGAIEVLQADPDDEDEGSPRHVRFVRLRPGRSAESERLALPPGAHAVLLPSGVAWSRTMDGTTSAGLGTLVDGHVGERRVLAARSLPRGAFARCWVDGVQVVVGEAEGATRMLLVHEGKPHLEDVRPGGELSCDGRAARWLHVGEKHVELLRCDRDGCRASSVDLPARARRLAAAPVAEGLVVVWTGPDGVLRARAHDATGARTDETILLDAPSHGGLEVRDLRAFGSVASALFLVEDARHRLVAIALDGHAAPTVVARRPW